MPGREDRTQNLIERCELDYVIGSVHFLGDLAVDWDRFDIWETAAQPRRGVDALLRDARARRRAAGSSMSSPTRTS